jgi:alkylhydroperoxidase/carboxymuconolactone decarboxylase family protein YurZ
LRQRSQPEEALPNDSTQSVNDDGDDERRRDLKRRFMAARGYWADAWERTLALDPDYFEAYLNFSSVPWNNGTLDPKVREFLYLALNASATHLYAPGIRAHMQNAIGYGATREELMEVFEIISVVGIHTMGVGLPILLDLLPLDRPLNLEGYKRYDG